MADSVFRRRRFGFLELASDERHRLDPVDRRHRVEMLQAEGAGAGEGDFERLGHAKPRLLACLSFPTAAKRTIENPKPTIGVGPWIPGQTCGLPGMTRM